jgi:hypothetical protein
MESNKFYTRTDIVVHHCMCGKIIPELCDMCAECFDKIYPNAPKSQIDKIIEERLEVGNVWVPKDPTHPLCGVEFVITSLNGKWVTISYQWGEWVLSRTALHEDYQHHKKPIL